MPNRPVEVSLEVNPAARLDVIDVGQEVQDQHGDILEPFPRALYCSFHTTAGYLDQSLATRLQQEGEPGVEPFVKVFQTIFPEMARQGSPVATGQQLETVTEPLGDLLDRKCTHAGRRELERERDAIQPAADVGHRRGVRQGQSKRRVRDAAARSTNRRTASYCPSAASARAPPGSGIDNAGTW